MKPSNQCLDRRSTDRYKWTVQKAEQGEGLLNGGGASLGDADVPK